MLRVFRAFFSIQGVLRGFKHFQWESMVFPLKLPVRRVLWMVHYMSSCIVDLWLFEIVVYSYRRDSSPLKKGDRRMSSCDVHLFPPSSESGGLLLSTGFFSEERRSTYEL